MAKLTVNRIRCNVCGGDLEQEENKFWRCAHCRSRFEISEQLPEETVVALNAANTDRMLFRFDDAREKYDLILEKSPTLSEACWGALLAFYGIKYEKDYDGVTFIPTCHRLSETPVEQCPYYPPLNDEAKQKATEIEALRKAVWTKSQTIQPYDVFLCYKQTDQYYERNVSTKESIWAREAYEMLTRDMGLRVFFAEKSLEQSNNDWEPHIYRALSTAKLMFVLTSSMEHVNSVWVKNEWKRFAAYIREGQDKTVRVVYDLFNPADLPRELSASQAISHDSMHWGENVKKAAEAVFNPTQSKKVEPELLSEPDDEYMIAPEDLNNVSEEKIAEWLQIGIEYFDKEKNPEEAVKWWKKAAQYGNADAQQFVGLAYLNGEGVEQDYTKAVKWLKKAAIQGHADAQLVLSDCYDKGEGVEKDAVESKKWSRKAASQGNINAQMFLGISCLIEGDNEEAVKWLKRAAEQGDAHAKYLLSCCYKDGTGVAEDSEQAEKLLNEAAELGDSDALYTLAEKLRTNFSTFLNFDFSRTHSKDEIPPKQKQMTQLYRQAAEKGHKEAQYQLGLLYLKGEGVEKDETKSTTYFQKAAGQGYTAAQYQLGKAYENGRGIERSHVKAFQWYKTAAEGETVFVSASFWGIPVPVGANEAKNALGRCYLKGIGVKQDVWEAIKWFEEAEKENGASIEYSDAMREVGDAYLNGTGVEKDEEKANEWYVKAFEHLKKCADKKNTDAQYKLAYYYLDGIGCERDGKAAMNLWLKAYEGNDTEALNAYLKQQEKWQAENVCQHCGGKFKGLFKKRCSNCGSKKDYKKSRKK